MTSPFLTIGMSTYDDFNGVYFSIMAHRLYQHTQDCEFIVLDNNPDSVDGQMTRDFVSSIADNENIRYIPWTEIKGTAQPRNQIIKEATGKFVMITDPHVMLQANAIHHLKAYLKNLSAQDQKNLFTGPLVYDHLNSVSTHFEPTWSGQMLGQWATAWKHPDGTLVVCKEIDKKVAMRPLNPEGTGEYTVTDMDWSRHEPVLMSKGYRVYGMGKDDLPFEIPAQGFGLFVASREDWIPFNLNYREFAGEEVLHHAKYRKAGRKTMCLPFLKWAHRFGRAVVPYRLTVEGKLRNFIIGHQELGWSLDPVQQHFVGEQGVSQATYDQILADPINYKPYVPPPSQPQTGQPVSTSNYGLPLPVVASSLSDVVDFLLTHPRDLDQHITSFSKYTLDCDHAVEITKRRESTAFLLGFLGRKGCGKRCQDSESCDRQQCKQPATLVSFQEEGDSLLGLLQELVRTHQGRPLSYTVSQANLDEMVPEIPETDLLFIDTRHNGKRALAELQAYAPKVRKRILLHDTATYGKTGDDGGEGFWWAFKAFLADNPEWFIAEHSDHQYGLTVLSRVPSDRPMQEVRVWPKTTREGNPCGVGQAIKGYLKMMGFESTDNCPCHKLALQYDAWGPELCTENIENIIDNLKEQAIARNLGHLFLRPAVRLMVKKAIRDAQKQIERGDCN